jgi:hypothetical protein
MSQGPNRDGKLTAAEERYLIGAVLAVMVAYCGYVVHREGGFETSETVSSSGDEGLAARKADQEREVAAYLISQKREASREQSPTTVASRQAQKMAAECAARGIGRKGGGAREEPMLGGVVGYVMASPTSEADRVGWKKRGWSTRALVQTGPDTWKPEGEAIQHKTRARIRKQWLGHAGFGRYVGRLEVELEGGRHIMVGLESFTHRPYWACPLREADNEPYAWSPSPGPVVAKLVDGARLVDSGGDWTILKKREQLLCEPAVGRIHVGSTDLAGVNCRVFDAKGNSTQHVLAQPDDLIIIY